MYDKTKYIYVGLDLHKEQHMAVIMDCINDFNRIANQVSAGASVGDLLCEQVRTIRGGTVDQRRHKRNG